MQSTVLLDTIFFRVSVAKKKYKRWR